jgi:hypothetical protein
VQGKKEKAVWKRWDVYDVLVLLGVVVEYKMLCDDDDD